MRRIPNYAKRLQQALESLDWPEGWAVNVQTYGSLDPTVIFGWEYAPGRHASVLLPVTAIEGGYLSSPLALVERARARFVSESRDPRYTEEARDAARRAADVLGVRFGLSLAVFS